MERTNFEKLRVYRLAEDLADDVWGITTAWPAFAKSTAGRQMERAAGSVPAHIAEGTGRGTAKDKRHFVRIARGSLYETQNWLRRAYRRELLTREQVETLKPIIDELGPTLNAYLRSIR